MSQNDNCLDTKIRHITPPKEDLQTLPSAFYNCNICGLQVKTQSNLRAHYIKTHGLVNDVKDTAFLLRKKTDISDVFHCPIPACKYTKATGTGFSKFWHLKQHYQLVHMKKIFQCHICNQRFSTPSAQAYHSKSCGTHIECPVCGRKYKAKKFLNQHARRSGHDIRSRASVIDNLNAPRHTSNHLNEPTRNEQAENLWTAANLSQSSPPKLAILPMLILPLGVSADQIPTSFISEVVSQLRSSLTIFPPFVSAPPTENGSQLSSITYSARSGNSDQVDQPHVAPVAPNPTITVPHSAVRRHLEANSQQPSSSVPLVDAGTTTVHFSNAYTQTEVNLPPGCRLAPPDSQSDFSMLYHLTRDSCTGTSPPDGVAHMSVGNSPPSFMPDISHTSTYMSPGHSIELQYPEMNSNSTMTNYHQTTAATALQPVLTQDRFVQQTCPLVTQQNAFQQTSASLYPSTSTDSGCYGYINRVDEPPPSSSSATDSRSGWRPMQRTNQPSLCAKSVQMHSANSVALETTLDLDNFDPNSSGNCFWPTSYSFSNTETQTVFDPAFDQWLNSVQTQTTTCPQGRQHQSNWTSTLEVAADGVCVGVNTDLLTPKHSSPY
uniref:C2H2-type domain-containing protein n=3 Tax=Mesocestoides corti TaxID=53468 RepID=A0A5K3FLU5_MESCO